MPYRVLQCSAPAVGEGDRTFDKPELATDALRDDSYPDRFYFIVGDNGFLPILKYGGQLYPLDYSIPVAAPIDRSS